MPSPWVRNGSKVSARHDLIRAGAARTGGAFSTAMPRSKEFDPQAALKRAMMVFWERLYTNLLRGSGSGQRRQPLRAVQHLRRQRGILSQSDRSLCYHHRFPVGTDGAVGCLHTRDLPLLEPNQLSLPLQ
jgi:hypothetical protein